MIEHVASRGITCVIGVTFFAAALAASAPAAAQSGDPIKIGFSLALTGPLAPNGKQALLGAKIWEGWHGRSLPYGVSGHKMFFLQFQLRSPT